MTARDQQVCICKYHENIDLLLEGLLKKLPGLPKKSEEVLEMTVCDIDCSTCVDRQCDKCEVEEVANPWFDGAEEDANVFYYQWHTTSDKKMVKELIESSVEEAKEDLVSQLEPFSRHLYNIRRQYRELKFLKEHLKKGQVITHEDFSENFQIKHQNEIMAAHWLTNGVTIFTVIVYYRADGEGSQLEHLSYAFVSDQLDHDKASVYTFNKMLLEDLKKITTVSEVHYWSDGCGSQFKSRFNMSNIVGHEAEFGTEATWSYFETDHGKGAVDGIGGEIKRAVWRAILQNRAVVNSAEEFATVAQRECNKIKVVYIAKVVISETITADLKARWEACKTVKGTHSVHFVKKGNVNSVLVAKNSQFTTQDECVEHQILKAPEHLASCLSSPSTGNQTSLAGNQCITQPSSCASMSIDIESYYAVDYVNRYYIGRAIRKSDVFVTFKYLHSIGTKFYWPGKDDIEAVHTSCVFFGPISLSGTGPFTIVDQSEVDSAWLLIKESRNVLYVKRLEHNIILLTCTVEIF